MGALEGLKKHRPFAFQHDQLSIEIDPLTYVVPGKLSEFRERFAVSRSTDSMDSGIGSGGRGIIRVSTIAEWPSCKILTACVRSGSPRKVSSSLAMRNGVEKQLGFLRGVNGVRA